MDKLILNKIIEIVDTTRNQRESQKESVSLRREVLLLNSSYRTEALLEALLVVFAEFIDREKTWQEKNLWIMYMSYFPKIQIIFAQILLLMRLMNMQKHK